MEPGQAGNISQGISGIVESRKRRKLKKKTNPKKQEAIAASLMKELRNYEQAGTRLYLDGAPTGARDIVRACMFAENTDYMRDFISDEADHITEIHFVKITVEQEKQN